MIRTQITRHGLGHINIPSLADVSFAFALMPVNGFLGIRLAIIVWIV